MTTGDRPGCRPRQSAHSVARILTPERTRLRSSTALGDRAWLSPGYERLPRQLCAKRSEAALRPAATRSRPMGRRMHPTDERCPPRACVVHFNLGGSWEPAQRREIMTQLDSSQLSARLDEDHHPETNGRMPICRRCGFRSAGPLGDERHVSAEERPTQALRWLDGQELLRRTAQARALLDQ